MILAFTGSSSTVYLIANQLGQGNH